MEHVIDENLFSGEIDGRVAVVRFKENLLTNLTDLDAKEKLFSFLRRAELDETIRVVLILGAPRRNDAETCRKFYERFASGQSGIDDLERLNNAVNQLVLKITGYAKLVIHAGRGNAAPLFVNLSLACDWRLIGDDSLFQNPCVDMGLIPKGGGVFFLTRLIGRAATSAMLLSGTDITPDMALSLGLVNQVVKTGDLEQEALAAARRFAAKPARAVWAVKRLLNHPLKELSAFLDYEDELIRGSFLCPVVCRGVQ